MKPLHKRPPVIFWLVLSLLDCTLAWGAPSAPLNLRIAPQGEIRGVGGMEGPPPEYVVMENVVQNADFEQGSTGWSLGGCYAIDDQVAHSGGKSLRLDLAPSCGASKQFNVTPGATRYTLRAWVKTQGLAGARLRLGVFDSSHSGASGASITVADADRDWQLVEKSVDVSPGHLGDRLELRVNPLVQGTPAGRVWVDDLTLVPSRPLFRLFVRYPNFRGYLWEDGSQVIRADLEVLPGLDYPASRMEVAATILNAVTFEELYRATFADPAQNGSFSWDAGGVPVGGEILLRAVLRDKESGVVLAQHPDYRIVKASATFRDGLNNWIDEDNVLHHAGRRRFVYGVYDRISGSYRPGGIATTVEAYEKVPGFNGLSTLDNYADTRCNSVLYFSPMSGASAAQINPWMEALRSRGATHLQIVNNYYSGNKSKPWWAGDMSEEVMWTTIGTQLTDPGLLGYYTADEPDLQGFPTVQNAFRQYKVLKSANRGSIALQVFFTSAPVSRWRDTADVFGADPYPIGAGPLPDDFLYSEGGSLLGRVDLWTDDCLKAVKDSRPVWMVLQLWTQAGKFPTYDEMRRMAWKAVISGAKGILWWGFVSASGMEYRWYGGYQSPCSPAPCDPNAYPDFKRISSEVMALEEVLLTDSVAGAVSCSDSRVRFTVKRFGGELWIFASNTANVPLEAVTFTSPEATGAGVEVYSESRTIPVDAASWTDLFAGQGVHVYRHVPTR